MRYYMIIDRRTGQVVREIGWLRDLKKLVGLEGKFVIVRKLINVINNRLAQYGKELTWEERPCSYGNVDIENLLK